MPMKRWRLSDFKKSKKQQMPTHSELVIQKPNLLKEWIMNSIKRNVVLLSDKIGFRAKDIIRDKEANFIMIKWT